MGRSAANPERVPDYTDDGAGQWPDATYFAQFPPICRADPLVRAGPPGPAADQRNQLLTANDQADGGVGRGPGGPPNKR